MWVIVVSVVVSVSQLTHAYIVSFLHRSINTRVTLFDSYALNAGKIENRNLGMASDPF